MLTVERLISIYEKEGDNLIQEFVLKMTLDEIRKIVKSVDDDPELYKVYSLTKDQYIEFSKVVPELRKFDFDKVAPFYECVTI